MKAMFSKKILILFLVLLALSIMGVWFSIILMKTEIMTDSGPMSPALQSTLGLCVTLITLSWLMSLNMLIRVTSDKICFVIDENGISNTFVFSIFLSLTFVCSIRSIPWEAVTAIKKNDSGALMLILDTSKIEAGFIGKHFLKHCFMFPPYYKDVKAQDIENEIKKYCALNIETSD